MSKFLLLSAALMSFIVLGGGLKNQNNLKIGAAISPKLLTENEKYREVCLDEFNSITTENALKWSNTRPSETTFDFSQAETIISWALKNNKRMHGHVLAWHQYPPKWLKELDGDSLKYETLLQNHIKTVVKKFKGKISGWDVVNEAIDENGNLRLKEKNENESWQTGSVWHVKLGPNFIERAFRYAHAADPNALLFYNDYSQESNAKKSKAICDLVKNLKAKGTPIHGIGLQFHMNYNTKNEGIINALKEAAATGLMVHISELDIRLNIEKKQDFIASAEMLELQKQKYNFVVKAYREYVPKNQQYGITTWNVGDADSWLIRFHKAPESPLLFDKDYIRKPAWQGFKDALF